MSSAESPIQNLDRFDVVGELKTGGVDLVVACSGALDGSADTIQRLEEKIRRYLAAARHDNFPNVYPAAARGQTRILVSCEYPVSPAAKRKIEELAQIAAVQGVPIQIVSSMA